MSNKHVFILIVLSFLSLVSCGTKFTAEEVERIKRAGIEKSKNGEYLEAIKLLERVSSYDVKDVQVYWYLAESYEGLGRMEKAVETWQKLLFVVDPKSQEAKDAHERFLRAKNLGKNQ